ncbi:helix-turn-helix domain-containing protein [Streptosporangium sp. NBC_01755]|uniref:GlxA family transcriptional regulator n=1 Tax=unclassified Streptosporangium TaxID=2632669 RepID=UPI002DDC3C86|nr:MULTISPECIES: helix-turn-helix domain-containing protein [unclassified Streptosporangium]WSA25362.1 helix-turn-helix domain-containing protein [Streptosporangium sp. NBC_01810]WSD03322.1 helix-turn-helix domain-containing protein [Streptosporangium sp. NBC_01755]
MHRVVVFAMDGVIPFELGIPPRIFGIARSPEGERLYEVLTCTVDGAPVRTDADFSIAVNHGAEALAGADTVVIPATHALGPISAEGRLPQPVADAIARIRPGTRLVSICTAAYVLAAAGLLDGRPATTHWSDAERFQKLFPQVKVNPEVLFVDDGDVLTSAGVAAGIDLCLHIVRRDHGTEVANRVARRCVVPPWRDGGQAQFIERPLPAPTATTTAATRVWALERLHEPLPLSELAAHARMSRRTFTRRFRDEMGLSPGQWLTSQRVELARLLLETSDLPVEGVALRAGFGTAASLRQHLQTAVGVSPMAYRRTFRPVDA